MKLKYKGDKSNEVPRSQEKLLLQVDKLTKLEIDYVKKLEELLEKQSRSK